MPSSPSPLSFSPVARVRFPPRTDRPPRRSLPRIELPIHRRVSQHRLHVFARFRKWNGFYKFGGLLVLVPGNPVVHAGFASIVGSQRLLPLAAPLIEQRAQIIGAEFQVDGGLKQGSIAEAVYAGAAGQRAAGGRLPPRETGRGRES